MTDPNTSVCERVLVVRFGRIGDMLVVTPFLRALRRARPDVQLDVLTSHEGRAILAHNPHVRSVHVLRARRVPRPINVQRKRIEDELRGIGFDTVFLLEGAQRYRELVARLGARHVYTFTQGNESADAFHARRGEGHELDNFFAVLALAGVAPDGEHYDFPLSDGARARARVAFERAGLASVSVFGVHPGFHQRRLRRRMHPKAWPLDRWAGVIRRLAEINGRRCVLTGSQREHAMNERIIAQLPGGLAHNLAGETDVETLGAVIERCDVFIAPDTGPAHLAAAVGTPLVALFGPKSPTIMGPRGDDRFLVRLYPDPSAAGQHERAGHHPRMWAIQVDDVVAAALALGENAALRRA